MLVKFPSLQELGKRAFITYLRSVYLKKVFDLSRFSAEQFSAYAASLGLPVTPTISFISHMKNVSKKDMQDIDTKQMKSSSKREVIITPKINSDLTVCDGDDDILYPKKPTTDANMDNGCPSFQGTCHRYRCDQVCIATHFSNQDIPTFQI